MFIQQTNTMYRKSVVGFVEGPTIDDAAWEIASCCWVGHLVMDSSVKFASKLFKTPHHVP